CFFFQAEDGIRDFHVTGVQTCALPISPDSSFGSSTALLTNASVEWRPGLRYGVRNGRKFPMTETAPLVRLNYNIAIPSAALGPEIGRASCRERVEIAGVHGLRL